MPQVRVEEARGHGGFCTCGNLLRAQDYRSVTAPCRCKKPGRERLIRPELPIPDWHTPTAIMERRRAGLPDCTDYERAVGAGRI